MLTIRWCPCVVFSYVVGRGCLLWPVRSLGKTLLAFALLHSIFQGQICLSLQVFLDFLLLYTSPLQWKGHLFWVLVLKGLVGLHRTVQLQLLSVTSIHQKLYHLQYGFLQLNKFCFSYWVVIYSFNLYSKAYLLNIEHTKDSNKT